MSQPTITARAARQLRALALLVAVAFIALSGSAAATPGGRPGGVRLAEASPDLSFVPRTASPGELVRVESLVGTTYGDLLNDWSSVFGSPTEVTIRLVRPADPITFSACNTEEPVNAPLTAFFCPTDRTIWLNDLLLVGFAARFGDFAVATVVAHEYAHVLQLRAGVFGQALPTLDIELHADCLAGLFAHTEQAAGRLTGADASAARAGLQAVGDTDLDSPDHHGTPAQRASAWSRGFAGQSCPLQGLA
jgi:predicted metalloprotease